MNAVDIVCLVALVLFALLGAWRGFLRQVFSLAALILIGLFAAPLGVLMALPVIAANDWDPGTATALRIGFVLGAALAIYIVVKAVGAMCDRSFGRREGGPGLAPWNRYWGAALGVVKAGILCWLVLSFLSAFPDTAPGAARRVEEAWSARTVQLYNPFERWILPDQREDMQRALVALWELKRHPSKWDDVMEEKSIQRVLKHKELAGLLDSERADAVVRALTDEDFRRSLREIDWGRVADVAEDALSEAEEPEEPSED